MLIQHKVMIEDRVRCNLYRKAIRQVVRKGDVVLDLGAGTGLLSYFAVQAGAGKVYAVERSDIIEEAREIAKANNWADKIKFIKGISTEVNLPEKVDVIISEILGHFALEEDVLRYIFDAKRRFLRKGGRLVPYYIEMILAPVEAPNIYKKEIKFWNKNLYGINFSKAREEAINSRHIRKVNPKGILAKPGRIYGIDLYKIDRFQTVSINNILKYRIKREGVVHGLVGWFCAKLLDEIILSTSPENRLTHWRNNFFPLQRPIQVSRGDIIQVKIMARALFNRLVWTWNVEALKRSKGSNRFKKVQYNHSTFKSLPLSKEHLLKLSKDYIPILNKEETIKLSILKECNGRNSVKEIAKKLSLRYPKHYGSLDEALAKVKEVTINCSVKE